MPLLQDRTLLLNLILKILFRGSLTDMAHNGENFVVNGLPMLSIQLVGFKPLPHNGLMLMRGGRILSVPPSTPVQPCTNIAYSKSLALMRSTGRFWGDNALTLHPYSVHSRAVIL